MIVVWVVGGGEDYSTSLCILKVRLTGFPLDRLWCMRESIESRITPGFSLSIKHGISLHLKWKGLWQGQYVGKIGMFSFGHAECSVDVQHVLGWMTVGIRRYSFDIQMVFKISRLDQITKCRQRRDSLSFGSLQN